MPRTGGEHGARPPGLRSEYGLVRELPSRAQPGIHQLLHMPLLGNDMEKQYWRSLDEPEPRSENDDAPGIDHSRREFLKAAGFAFAGAAAFTGCSRAPVEKAMPYL